MGVKLETVLAVICACAALHNIAIVAKDSMDPLLHDKEEESDQDTPEYFSCSGLAARDGLVQRFFQ